MDVTTGIDHVFRVEDLVGGRGVPAAGDPGRAGRELAAGRPATRPGPPDHALSEYDTRSFDIRAASVRGLMHRYQGGPRQDAFSVVHDEDVDTTVVVVCDGVGSLERSHDAAGFVTGHLPLLYRSLGNWADAVHAVNDSLRGYAEDVRRDLGLDEDPADHRMATTVAAVAIVPEEGGYLARIVRSDDSTVWHLDTARSAWTPVSVPGADVAGHPGSVQALPADVPRLHHTEFHFGDGALFVVTDGVGDPLHGSPDVRDTLAAWWSTPPTAFEFGSQVGFAAKTHTDDRTAVGIWWRRPAHDPAEHPG